MPLSGFCSLAFKNDDLIIDSVWIWGFKIIYRLNPFLW
jgi:hypothetical protein